jgi:hypothetical protein
LIFVERERNEIEPVALSMGKRTNKKFTVSNLKPITASPTNERTINSNNITNLFDCADESVSNNNNNDQQNSKNNNEIDYYDEEAGYFADCDDEFESGGGGSELAQQLAATEKKRASIKNDSSNETTAQQHPPSHPQFLIIHSPCADEDDFDFNESSNLTFLLNPQHKFAPGHNTIVTSTKTRVNNELFETVYYDQEHIAELCSSNNNNINNTNKILSNNINTGKKSPGYKKASVVDVRHRRQKDTTGVEIMNSVYDSRLNWTGDSAVASWSTQHDKSTYLVDNPFEEVRLKKGAGFITNHGK